MNRLLDRRADNSRMIRTHFPSLQQSAHIRTRGQDRTWSQEVNEFALAHIPRDGSHSRGRGAWGAKPELAEEMMLRHRRVRVCNGGRRVSVKVCVRYMTARKFCVMCAAEQVEGCMNAAGCTQNLRATVCRSCIA